MCDELADGTLQRRFAEENQVVEALFLDGYHKAFRERIQVRASRRQAQALDACRLDSERRRELGVAV
jgi:hypothetical protein